MPLDNLLWCERHYKLQQKSYRCYKFASTLLEECKTLQRLTYASIDACDTMQQLLEWDSSLRHEYVLYSRTIQGRRKHHDAFYEGGDEGHNNWVDMLAERRDMLEDLLAVVEDRAYALILKNEEAAWLSVLPNDEICSPAAHEHDQDCGDNGCIAASSTSGTIPEPARQQPEVSDHVKKLVRKSQAIPRKNTQKEDEFIAKAYEAYQNWKTQQEDYRTLLLGYYKYPEIFVSDPAEHQLAVKVIDNIFRYVLARHARLLFHVRRINVDNVRAFLEHESLETAQLKQLWEGMKMRGYHGIGKEGKITIDVLKAAIQDAEYPEDGQREGDFIEILGGKVWSKRLKGDVSERGWDHLYPFVNCASCAFRLAIKFKTQQRLLRLAKPGYLYQHWSFARPLGNKRRDVREQQFPKWERIFLDRGGTLEWTNAAKGQSIEAVRPAFKGAHSRTIYIEREERSWIMVRFPKDHPHAQRLANTDRADLLVWSRSGTATEAVTNRPVPKDFWIKRLRAGPTAVRKRLPWTIDKEGCYPGPPCWIRDYIKDSCPCKRHERAKKQTVECCDIIVVDVSTSLNFPALLSKMLDVLGPDSVIDDSAYVLANNEKWRKVITQRLFHETADLDPLASLAELHDAGKGLQDYLEKQAEAEERYAKAVAPPSTAELC